MSLCCLLRSQQASEKGVGEMQLARRSGARAFGEGGCSERKERRITSCSFDHAYSLDVRFATKAKCQRQATEKAQRWEAPAAAAAIAVDYPSYL